MGCNCGKGKTTNANAPKKPIPAGVAPNGKTPAIDAGGKPMKGVTQAFTLTSAGGRTQTFGSQLEADAARVRQGGPVTRTYFPGLNNLSLSFLACL
jgi:hypothetical protein